MDAILLPGAILPARIAYEALLGAFDRDVTARAKELEVYGATEVPPPAYGLDTEVAGIDRDADAAGFERFHLVGYSAGGASSLAYALARPDRLLSLTLAEPAWAGVEGRTPEEAAAADRAIAATALPPDQMLPAFMRAQLADDVEPPQPPPDPPPPWMASRPAGTRAIAAAFGRFAFPPDGMQAFDRPVLFVLGGLSNPDYYRRMAERLERWFPDFRLEVFDGRHHFDPPHRAEPEGFARLLEDHWRRAEARSP
ncbi:MAG: alpha/beta hydrolase [Actinomycetota bacterium]|nr:alpha/beta hydrolase [Actinomycetota bacterium]